MSKLKYILLLLAIALVQQVSKAERVKIGELYYELNDQNFTAEVTYEKYDSKDNYGSLSSLAIPEEISYNSKKYTVSSIGKMAFGSCNSLTVITIPNTVTSIGNDAFLYCYSLTRVDIFNLEEWCKIKFEGYNSNPLYYAHHLYLNNQEIKDLVVPNSVTSIGRSTFGGCTGLISVTIPGSVISIEEFAFYDCSGLNSVTIPNSVISIGNYAFSGCSGLTSVTIPNSVNSIGQYAFSRCSRLNNIIIPNSVKSIGEEAFSGCSGLTSVTIPNSITEIANGAFRDCSGLTSITIPNFVTSIRRHAFKGCRGLTSVTIPSSVTSIGRHAFEGCSGLTSVTIPNSVTSVGYWAFSGCNSLKKIIAPQNLVSELKNNYKNIDIVADENYYASKERDKENQKTVQGVNTDKNLANANSSSKKTNEIKKEKAKNDKTTSAKKSEYQELNDNMLSWEEFYRRNRKARLTYENVSQIEAHINREIEKWQVKDEFESTNEWRARVNETTRQQKVKEMSAPLIEQHNREVAQINEEQKRLAQEYEKYRQDLIDGYYRNLVAQATKDFSAGDFSLNPYDADHGTFLIRSARYGDILLPIAARDEARSFKENWETIKRNVKPEFVPNGEEVALTKLIFTNNGKQYVYDSHTEANYAVTDVKYNFKPVELADISLADINTNLPALTNSDVSAQIISKTSNEAITPQRVQPSKNTVVASERSDVDYAIPTGRGDANSTTYAVIIANENYKTLSKVPYAANDGEIMARYLTSAVGLPQNHVKVYHNATVGSMAEAVSYMEDLGKAYGDKLNLIFYYAGHGVPDEKTKTALLLPVDGNPSISKTCYPVDELVKNLGNLKANNVVVLLDACFSGATRNDEMLVAARGVKLHSNEIVPIGNMVFFSATQGDETAYSYEKEGHGLFTYFLLKKLQENRGKVTLGELADYVIENVRQKSIETNGKLQTPTVTVSRSLVGSWRDIRLK